MTDLGMRLAWCAWQASLVLVPAVVLHVAASRRSTSSGSWMAAFGLFVCVTLSVAVWLPIREWLDSARPSPTVASAATSRSGADSAAGVGVAEGRRAGSSGARARHEYGLAVSLEPLPGIWRRLERGATAPIVPMRRWGRALAVVGLVGAGAGLLRLLLGLWAVHVCRARGRLVDDTELLDLLDALRASLGIKCHVEIREVADLTTPATAGWLRPIIMLPQDWRSWDDAERRAVLAHELVHVVRGDYAAGLVARLALALHFYHPLVHWLAVRLQLQQELAADAWGAQLAGGRAQYLLALSRLALRQDGRTPGWPARAFLPARGALIRRIAMLQNDCPPSERPWSRTSRLVAALALLSFGAAVALLPSPARSDAGDKPTGGASAPVSPARTAANPSVAPIDWLYVPEKMDGLVAVRPAAAFKRFGIPGLAAQVRAAIGHELVSVLLKDAPVLRASPAPPSFPLEQVEWATAGIRFGNPNGKDSKREQPHSMIMGVATIRMAAPFDWLAFLRAWGIECVQVRVGERAYYKITGKLRPLLGPNPCFYLPDDRTIVLAEGDELEKLARRGNPVVPAYLTGTDWQEASRGLLAVAIGNHDGSFLKRYDLGRSDDAAILPLWQGADHWVASLADGETLSFRALATCTGGPEAQAIAKAAEALLRQGRQELEPSAHVDHPVTLEERSLSLGRKLLAGLRVVSAAQSVEVRADGFGSFAELGRLVAASFQEDESVQAKRVADKPRGPTSTK